MRAVLLADTHLRDGSDRQLDDAILEAVRDADVVLHAGDVVGQDLLDELAVLAPLHVVRGNNDVTLHDLPETLELDLDGVQVSMVHDAGARAGRPARLARRFPTADLVVFGHSHLPEDLTETGAPRIFNPGSPTQRRRAPSRTYGVLGTRAGRIVELRHVHLD